MINKPRTLTTLLWEELLHKHGSAAALAASIDMHGPPAAAKKELAVG
jgi:hypothetical protein